MVGDATIVTTAVVQGGTVIFLGPASPYFLHVTNWQVQQCFSWGSGQWSRTICSIAEIDNSFPQKCTKYRKIASKLSKISILSDLDDILTIESSKVLNHCVWIRGDRGRQIKSEIQGGAPPGRLKKA